MQGKEIVLNVKKDFEDYGEDYMYQLDFERNVEIVNRVLKYSNSPENRIVDLGCGYGIVATALTKYGYNVFGLDDNMDCPEEKERMLEFQRTAIKFVMSNLYQNLPFKDESCDMIILAEVIEHLFSPKNLLTEIHRILKPKGILLVSTQNAIRLPFRISVLFGTTGHISGIRRWYDDANYRGHLREYTMADLIAVLEWSSFKVIEKTLVQIRQKRVKKGRYLKHQLSIFFYNLLIEIVPLFLPTLRNQIFVVARRVG